MIEALLQVFPDSVESMAVDVIPVDENADPETWQGEWVEKRWTPLSRAIDRGLDAIVVLFREALHQSKAAAPPPSHAPSNVTAKSLQQQSRPPMHNNSMVLGGKLDSPSKQDHSYLGEPALQGDRIARSSLTHSLTHSLTVSVSLSLSLSRCA